MESTWKPMEEAPMGQVVLATKDNDVYAGRITDGFLTEDVVFVGYRLSDGKWNQFTIDNLDGWQLAPDTWKEPEKSADEMFEELGYSEVVSQDNEKWYRKKTEDCTITLIIDFDTKFVDCRIGRNTYSMEFGEILACAQLIKEMEADHGEVAN